MIVDENSQLFERIVDSLDRKSTRLNSSHTVISYAVFCLKAPAPTAISTLSLHDALPISQNLASDSGVSFLLRRYELMQIARERLGFVRQNFHLGHVRREE